MYRTKPESAEQTSLSFLELSLEAVEGTQSDSRNDAEGMKVHPKWKESALLDSGATACAISITQVLKYDLNVVEAQDAGEIIVRTASVDEVLEVRGKVQLKLRWKDRHGKPRGTKTWMYVVYGMRQEILLSHDFLQRHPEVWDVASKVRFEIEEFNPFWFQKLSKEQERAEAEYFEKRRKENIARAEDEKRERLNTMDQRLASGTLSQASASSATSVPGSNSTSLTTTALRAGSSDNTAAS
jgi:hypothetical protein